MRSTENAQASALESVRAVVDRLRARHDEIAQAIYHRIREAVPDSVGARDPTYQTGVLAAVNAVLAYSLHAIEHGPGWSEPIPPEATAQARRAARAGISSGAVLRRYVAGHGRLGEFVAEETERIGLAINAPALLHISRTQDALLGHITAAIEHEHDQERQRIGCSQSRLEIVKRLLRCDPVAPAELTELDYELDGSWHLGLIAIGENADDALRELSICLGHKQLRVSCDDETVWAWIGGPHRLAITDIERLLSTTSFAAVSLAVGEPARGIEGWRQTHRSAQLAHLVARCRRHGLTRYLDVALEATLLQDEALADVLIEGYLSPLDDENGGGLALRRTLRAIFDAEHNVSSAASILKVDRRTVHRWLGEIEQRLGYRLHEHQAEIEIALRLEKLRGDHANGGSG
jgi:GGDEF-like domain